MTTRSEAKGQLAPSPGGADVAFAEYEEHVQAVVDHAVHCLQLVERGQMSAEGAERTLRTAAALQSMVIGFAAAAPGGRARATHVRS